MTTNLQPKPRLSWTDTPPPQCDRQKLLRHLLSSHAAVRTLVLLSVLTLLGFCYAGPLTRDAAQVIAVKRELPIYSVDRSDDRIAISFDASWGGDKTLGILDLLDEYNVKATFFLVGIWVDKYPELVKEIAARGHEIGNHSAKHPYMTRITPDQMRTELAACSDQIEALTGTRPTLFRPPYGDYNNQVVNVVRGAGYECVQWSVDSQDWKNRGASDIIKRASADVRSGDIVLFHNDSEYILDALPTVLQRYKDQGLHLVTVGELLLDGPYILDVQGKQHAAS